MLKSKKPDKPPLKQQKSYHALYHKFIENDNFSTDFYQLQISQTFLCHSQHKIPFLAKLHLKRFDEIVLSKNLNFLSFIFLAKCSAERSVRFGSVFHRTCSVRPNIKNPCSVRSFTNIKNALLRPREIWKCLTLLFKSTLIWRSYILGNEIVGYLVGTLCL